MKKIIMVNGIIAGLIVSTMMVVSTYHCQSTGDFENGMIYGYTSMIVAFSMVFVGVKTFRDKYHAGTISFGKAFKVGIIITLVASTFYVVTWLIVNYFFMQDFGEVYTTHMLNKLKASGAGQAEIAAKTAELMQFNEMYKNPFFKVVMTYLEILPVGLVITLISAAVLKRKKTQRQTA